MSAVPARRDEGAGVWESTPERGKRSLTVASQFSCGAVQSRPGSIVYQFNRVSVQLMLFIRSLRFLFGYFTLICYTAHTRVRFRSHFKSPWREGMLSVMRSGRKRGRVWPHSGWRCGLVALVLGLGAGQAMGQVDCVEEQKLTASDVAPQNRFGLSVSVSGDAALIYAVGGAYVFRFNGTSWIEEQKLTVADMTLGGFSSQLVSLSGDTAFAAGAHAQAAYVFRFNGISWVEEQKLTASDAASAVSFGNSVTVSGTRALVGAHSDHCAAGLSCGSAYVFRFNGTSWIEEQKLTGSEATAGALFGQSVSLSGDTAVVGARWSTTAASGRTGSAYVFRFNGTSWVEEQKLTASDAAGGDDFGVSVSLSGDTLLVGASYEDCGAGHDCGSAYVFRFDGTSWLEVQKLTASDANAEDLFGSSVSVSGNTAVVGASQDNCPEARYCGAVYVFRFNGTGWVEEQKLTAGPVALGLSVSLDGNTMVLGAQGDDCPAGSQCGAAYVYDCLTSCGNGNLDLLEECDGGDACTDCDCDLGFESSVPPSVDCQLICGNGNLDPEEECDGGLGCTDCHCDTGFEPTNPGSVACQPVCGNGILNPGEQCDGSIGCTDCFCDLGFEPTVPPSVDCQPTCGNSILDPGEACDGGLGCTGCLCDSAFEPTAPMSLHCQPKCGNGNLDSGEECDRMNDAVCPGLCQADCTCGPYCGDGTCDPGEDSCSCAADCGTPPSSELLESTCADGLDNDCDGVIDAEDPDCAEPVIPTITQWGMIFLALLLLVTGKIVFRRMAT